MTQRWALALVLVAAGLGLRLIGIADPPLDFHPTRQFRAALIARSYVLDRLPLTDAQRQAAVAAVASLPPIEPPIMEHLAAAMYRATGTEHLSLPRALSAVAWCAGGLALFWLAVEMLSTGSALVALAVYLFLPFAIRASRSFQPDPLMVALTVLALAAAASYVRRPRLSTAAVLAIAAGSAVAVKAMALFFLGPGLFALIGLAPVPWRLRLRAIILIAIAVIPGIVYYASLPLAMNYGPFPQFLREGYFWRGWVAIVGRVISLTVAVALVAGASLATGIQRRLLWALVAGYALFGFVFTYHIYTHDYYSLPLIPIAALAVGALIERIPRPRSMPAWKGAIATAVVIVLVACGGLETAAASSRDRGASFRYTARSYEAIGATVHHSIRVSMLDDAYGFALEYYGYLAGTTWPLSIDLAAAAGTGNGESTAPPPSRLVDQGIEYFVCTVQPELQAQPALEQFLDRRYTLARRDGSPERWASVVYDLTQPIVSTTPGEISLFARVGGPGPEERVSLSAPDRFEWRAESGSPDVRVEPPAGRGPASLRIFADPPASAGERQVTVTVRSGGRAAATIDVRYHAVAGPDRAPFGSFDAPSDPITMGDAPVVLMGWALDDISMTRVTVDRVEAGGAGVLLGEAQRAGRRPDVSALFPGAHDLTKASWAFRLEPQTVRGVQRPFRIRVFAEDGVGHRVEIGARTVR